MIIDSPGVGESDEMDEMVIQYLPQAFAFIYVIDCTNAGGIQSRVSIYRPFQVRKAKTKFTCYVCGHWQEAKSNLSMPETM